MSIFNLRRKTVDAGGSQETKGNGRGWERKEEDGRTVEETEEERGESISTINVDRYNMLTFQLEIDRREAMRVEALMRRDEQETLR